MPDPAASSLVIAMKADELADTPGSVTHAALPQREGRPSI